MSVKMIGPQVVIEDDEEEDKKNKHALLSKQAHNTTANQKQKIEIVNTNNNNAFNMLNNATSSKTYAQAAPVANAMENAAKQTARKQVENDLLKRAKTVETVENITNRINNANVAFRNSLELQANTLDTARTDVMNIAANTIYNAATFVRELPLTQIENYATGLHDYAQGNKNVLNTAELIRIKTLFPGNDTISKLVKDIEDGTYKGSADDIKQTIYQARVKENLDFYNEKILPWNQFAYAKGEENKRKYGGENWYNTGNVMNFAGATGANLLGFGLTLGAGLPLPAASAISALGGDTSQRAQDIASGKTTLEQATTDIGVEAGLGALYGVILRGTFNALNKGLKAAIPGGNLANLAKNVDIKPLAVIARNALAGTGGGYVASGTTGTLKNLYNMAQGREVTKEDLKHPWWSADTLKSTFVAAILYAVSGTQSDLAKAENVKAVMAHRGELNAKLDGYLKDYQNGGNMMANYGKGVGAIEDFFDKNYLGQTTQALREQGLASWEKAFFPEGAQSTNVAGNLPAASGGAPSYQAQTAQTAPRGLYAASLKDPYYTGASSRIAADQDPFRNGTLNVGTPAETTPQSTTQANTMTTQTSGSTEQVANKPTPTIQSTPSAAEPTPQTQLKESTPNSKPKVDYADPQVQRDLFNELLGQLDEQEIANEEQQLVATSGTNNVENVRDKARENVYNRYVNSPEGKQFIKEYYEKIARAPRNVDINGKQEYNTSDNNYSQTEGSVENEFRELQETSGAMSARDTEMYHTGERQVDEGLRNKLSNVLGGELRAKSSSSGYGNAPFINQKTGDKTDFYTDVDAETFSNDIKIVQKYLRNGDAVDAHEADTYKNSKNYLTNDGLGGFAITDEGDLISVFNLGKAGFLNTIADTVKKNAKTLDCFQSDRQPLADIYGKALGFKKAAVMDFNYDFMVEDRGKEYADYFVETYGEAPVVFMVNTNKPVQTKHFNKDQYDEAKAYQMSFIGGKDNGQITEQADDSGREGQSPNGITEEGQRVKNGTRTSKLGQEFWQRQRTTTKEQLENILKTTNKLNSYQNDIKSAFQNKYGIEALFFDDTNSKVEFYGCANGSGSIYLSSNMRENFARFVSKHELAEMLLLKGSPKVVEKLEGLINIFTSSQNKLKRYAERKTDNIEEYTMQEIAKEVVCDINGIYELPEDDNYRTFLETLFGKKLIDTIKKELDNIFDNFDLKEAVKKSNANSGKVAYFKKTKDAQIEQLEKANKNLRNKLAKQQERYEQKLFKQKEKLKENYKNRRKVQSEKRKVRLAAKQKRESEERRFKSAKPLGKLKMLGNRISKQVGNYVVDNFPELDKNYKKQFGKTIRETIKALSNKEVFPYLPKVMQDIIRDYANETYLKANWKTLDKYLREALEVEEIQNLIENSNTPVSNRLLKKIQDHNAAPIMIKSAREMYNTLQILSDIVEIAQERMNFKRENPEIQKTLDKVRQPLEKIAVRNTPKKKTDRSAAIGKIADKLAGTRTLPQYLNTEIQAVMGGDPNSALKIIWDWFNGGNEKSMELDVKFAENFNKFVKKAVGGWKYVGELDKDLDPKAKAIDTGITGSNPNGEKYKENAKLTKQIIMHIVASSKNQDNLMSFSKVLLGKDQDGNPVYSEPGGYIVPDDYWMKRENVDKAYDEGKRYVFSKEELDHLESLLTPLEKEFVDACLNVGNITAKYGNEVSQKLIGRDIFTVDNYVRIIRDRNTFDQELIDPTKLENLANAMSEQYIGLEGVMARGGSMEARNHKSRRAVYGESILQSVTNSFKGAKKYISYAIPLYDTDMLLKSRYPDTFEKVKTVEQDPSNKKGLGVYYTKVDKLPTHGTERTYYVIENNGNYDIYKRTEEGKTLKQLITATGNKGFFDFYNKFVDRIVGRTQKYSKFASLRAKVMLNANLSVAATQFFSYFQIGQFMNKPIRSMVKGLVGGRTIYKLSKKYLEEHGKDLTGLKGQKVVNKFLEDVTFLNTFRGLGKFSQDTRYVEAGSNVLGRIDTGGLMSIVDKFTVDATFRVLMYDIMADGYEFGTDEFIQQMKDRLYAVYQSNPQYAEIYKTPLQAIPGIGTALSQFQTVMIEGYNNILQASMAVKYYKKEGDKANLKKARHRLRYLWAGLAFGTFLLAEIYDLVKSLQGKADNKRDHAERIALSFIQRMLSYTIIGDEIFGALTQFNNYDITTNELSYFNNLLDILGYLGKSIVSPNPSDAIHMVKASLNAIGIPANGIEDILALIGNFTGSKLWKAYSVSKNKTMYNSFLKNADKIDGDIATFYDMKQKINDDVLMKDYGWIKRSTAGSYNSKSNAKARAIKDVLGYPQNKILGQAQAKEVGKWIEVFKNN